jgi:hypothetical protein
MCKNADFTVLTMPQNGISEQTLVFLHASYVAFVFGVLFFGALAFRQVLDNLDVRRVSQAEALGEDRDSFVDAGASVTMILIWLGLVALATVIYALLPASVYTYALPLIGAVQALQITLRVYFQRTLVRTRGVMVRRVWMSRLRPIRFADLVMVRLRTGRVWTDVVLGLPQEEVRFRIFSLQAPRIASIVQASSTAPVLWSSSRDDGNA